jgi:hypothetical protein
MMAKGKAAAGRRGWGREWRRRFLSALARTANAKLSADMAGVDHSTAYLLRARDAGFAADWVRARAWGRARVKAEGRPVHAGGRPRAAQAGGPLHRASHGPPPRSGEDPDPRELILRTSKNAGTQIVRAGEGRWSPRAEEDFFAHVAAGFGLRRSAEAVGFSATAVYQRRKRDPDFAARLEEAREYGAARNDQLLIDSVQWTLDPAAIEAAEDLPRPTIAEAIQIARLYRPAGEGAERGREPWRRPRSLDEVRGSILTKLEAIKRHRTPEKLAAGWTKSEDGHWIPPGWVKSGPEEAGGAAEGGQET